MIEKIKKISDFSIAVKTTCPESCTNKRKLITPICDYSKESPAVKSLCDSVFTQAVKDAYLDESKNVYYNILGG